ncbi:Flagellar basal body-associated protein FliL [Micromonospora narathiwatensis]|uniref:Flagellar basal body-associated protein FliL n=1 Tax=Micromonospora narathiwatensis TaxID=299146 RepID=A0A1A9AAH3_9ACTN|nr:Flagellar basal body-associated protein FliL [Micromonospora narathiwatensis]
MANFGPPGGGSPEPWGGRRPQDGYAADPRYDSGYADQPGGWGEPPAQRYEPDGWHEQPTQRYEPPVSWGGGQPTDPTGYQGYPVDPGYDGQPYAEPEPPKRGRGPLVALLAVLVVLGLGGAGAYWFLGRDDSAPANGTAAPAAPTVDPVADPTEPADPATTAPAPASSTDPRFVKAGQCVRNEGAADQPKLVISECGAKTYQVLRRIDGPTSGKKDAQAKCAKVEDYTDWYFFDSELDTLDFVLCLKRR